MTRLEYEGYIPMAEKKMREICAEVSLHGWGRVALWFNSGLDLIQDTIISQSTDIVDEAEVSLHGRKAHSRLTLAAVVSCCRSVVDGTSSRSLWSTAWACALSVRRV